MPSPYLVPADGTFRVADAPSAVAKPLSKKAAKKRLKELVEELSDLQEMLYADDRFAVLCIFQAMDAAGKDGTIRAVFSGVNPAGCQVVSFKQPSKEELDHDFLWRTARQLPERGRIGIFNRSYYEEVLVVKVHPEYLAGQRVPDADLEQVFADRYQSIREHEAHLARNRTVVLKFWLNVSHGEQRDRFIARIDEPEKNWKFSAGDVSERKLWPQYMAAYEEALNATSRPDAPWFAIPADDKPNMRVAVAEILVETLRALPLAYPKLSAEETAALSAHKQALLSE